MAQSIAAWLEYNLKPQDTLYIDNVLWAIAKRQGIESLYQPGTVDFTYLGAGHFSRVYWLDDKTKILKITKDKSDANASQILLKRPTKTLLKVYDVFSIKYNNHVLYGIVAEKLTSLSHDLKMKFITFTYFLDYWFGSFFPSVQQLTEAAQSNPQAWANGRTIYEVTDEYLTLFMDWAEALDTRSIRWGDYKSENIMMRQHTPVIVDLGYSKVPTQRIPVLGA